MGRYGSRECFRSHARRLLRRRGCAPLRRGDGSAGLRATGGGYRVSAGIGTVLELHAYRVVPMPDAASGYTLLLQLDSAGLLDGQEHSLPMPGVRAFLSVLHAPNLDTTSAVIGTLRLLPSRAGALDARLALSAPAAHWAYTGKAHFRPRPPSCFHRADWYVRLRGRRGCPPISE